MTFISYRRFFNKEQAAEFTTILEKHSIQYEVVEDAPGFDDNMYGQKVLEKDIMVKVRQEDFASVNKLVEEKAKQEVSDAPKDHYLYTFSDEELFEIVSKPDEWNEFDYVLAQHILKDRGKEINESAIELLKAQRQAELTKPVSSQKTLIYAGYVFALLGGALGLLIGWQLYSSKKTLANGNVIFAFTREDRKHGFLIFCLGILFFLLGILAAISKLDF